MQRLALDEIDLIFGMRSVCRFCNQPIEYAGGYWRHTDNQFRHVSQPILDNNRQIVIVTKETENAADATQAAPSEEHQEIDPDFQV